MRNKTLPSGQRKAKGGKLVPALCNVVGTFILLSVIGTCLPVTVPQFMGYEVYNVVSGSMEPEIPVGSVIYVAAAQPEDIREEDVIAFRSGDTIITHRVVTNRKLDGEFVTKGDANELEDMNSVPYENLVGRVEHHFPIVGRLMVVYTGTVGKAYVICFAACGAMLNMLAGRLRDRNKEKET